MRAAGEVEEEKKRGGWVDGEGLRHAIAGDEDGPLKLLVSSFSALA